MRLVHYYLGLRLLRFARSLAATIQNEAMREEALANLDQTHKQVVDKIMAEFAQDLAYLRER